MIIQNLPSESVSNDLIANDLDTIIFKMTVPANWNRSFRMSARFQGYNKSKIESLGESAIKVDNSTDAVSSYLFTTTGNHNFKFTEGTHYIKITMMSGFNGLDVSNIALPMYLVFGNPKYMYRTCSSFIGIGNIIKNNLPYDVTNYLLSDKSTSPASSGELRMYNCKCSDISKVIAKLYNAGTPAYFIGQSSDIEGNIACFENKNAVRFYCANTKLTGDIANLGHMINLAGNTTADPAVYIEHTNIGGALEDFADGLFDNGKTHGSIMVQAKNTNVTYEGELLTQNALISFTTDGYTVTLS
jgi:hypothetical protein